MKRNKIIYWIATGILCALFTFSAGMYLFSYPRAEAFFIGLGFPTWLIYPLAILKILGIVAILSKKSNFLKELAYAGFIFDTLLAFSAHLMVNDGEFQPALIGIIVVTISWFFDRKLHGAYYQQ